jgi:Ca2+-binding RTX toxin-like protein
MPKRFRRRGPSFAARFGALLVAGLVLAPGGAHGQTRVVYVSSGFPTGSQNITALSIGANGALTPVAGSPFSTGGSIVEGLAITPDARRVYVVSFGTNDVRGFNVAANGTLSSTPGSPFGGATNPLGVIPAPDGSRVYVWNHGSSIGSWAIGATGALAQVAGSPFAVPGLNTNPFAGSAAPNGQFLYAPNENSTETVVGCSGTCEVNRVSAYSVSSTGQLASIQGSGVITGSLTNAGGPNPFGSAITPDGRFVYVSNPEDGTFGTISAFAVNTDGTLSSQLAGFPLSTAPGNHPLAMVVSPDGRFLYVATRVTNSVNAYSIGTTGALTAVPGSPFATGGTNGKALALTPDGRRLYVSNNGSNNVSGFNVAMNGALTLIPGSPWATGGTNPDLESIVITPNQAPSASFAVVAAPHGQPTRFDAASSADADGGTIARYSWDFGDGTTDPDGGPTPTHVYAAAGTYAVTLTVTDNEGCSTERIFTGKAMLCNGQPTARTTSQAIVVATKCGNLNATIVGTPGADSLTGTPGRDVIAALGGDDRLNAQGGNDRACGGDGRDRVSGGGGHDVVTGEGGNDTLSGNAGNDSLYGNAGNDSLYGNAGNDRLYGHAGRDRLFGNTGRDRLIGGPGRDRLNGGPGRDVTRQ